ncbi:MAG: sensor histidine kinase [Magnetococcales bacterium]|nr:sensor histidine kinase [Magnetococcales bacterium]
MVWSLRTRLIFWFGTLFLSGLFCTLAVTLWGVPFTRLEGRIQQLRSETYQQLNWIADLHKEQIESWLEDKRKDVQMIATHPLLPVVLSNLHNDSNRDTLKVLLRSVANSYPEFDHVELLALPHHSLFSSQPLAVQGVSNDSFLHHTLLARRGYLGRPKRLGNGTHPQFRIGIPIFADQDQPLAVLVAFLSADTIFKELFDAGERLSGNGEVLLVDDAGHLLSSAKYPHTEAVASGLLVNKVGYEGLLIAPDYRNVSVVAAVRYLRLHPEWGMGLLVKTDQSELLRLLQQEIVSTLLIGVTACLVLLAMSYFLVRQQMQRLDLVSHTAARLADNELGARSQLQGEDEIGLLGQTLDHMAVRMEATIQALTREAAEHRQTVSDLAQLNEELRNFTYIVSHDLRSPLLSIQGFSEELHLDLKELDEQLTPLLPAQETARSRQIRELQRRLPEDLHFVQAATEKMERLINAVLKLSRTGHLELRQERVDLQAVVEENIQALAYAIRSAGATVTVDPLPRLLIDRTAIEQIVGNLLNNAIKYLEPGRPGMVHISATVDHALQRITLCMADNGRGVAQEDLKKIFMLFHRVGKQDTPGEGMGLAYVLSLVRRLGGRIQCQSTLGSGSLFRVTLPYIVPPTDDC